MAQPLLALLVCWVCVRLLPWRVAAWNPAVRSLQLLPQALWLPWLLGLRPPSRNPSHSLQWQPRLLPCGWKDRSWCPNSGYLTPDESNCEGNEGYVHGRLVGRRACGFLVVCSGEQSLGDHYGTFSPGTAHQRVCTRHMAASSADSIGGGGGNDGWTRHLQDYRVSRFRRWRPRGLRWSLFANNCRNFRLACNEKTGMGGSLPMQRQSR
jgi:hypothetical protein